jgi:hypothetical protein
VQGACGGAVGGEGRDEGCDGDCGRVGEELCDLVVGLVVGSGVCKEASQLGRPYLSNTPDVLVPVLLAEPKVLVQSKAHIVAIETVGGEAQVQQVLLERSCDGRLSGRREASEPDGEAGLLAECIALLTGEGWVPCDVASRCQYSLSWSQGAKNGGMAGFRGAPYVAILM